MLSDEILSSYIGSEVTVRFLSKGHTSGILSSVDKNSILLRTEGSDVTIARSKIKYIEHKPPGNKEFEVAIKNALQNLITSGKAKTEKEAVALLKRKFNKDVREK